MMRREQLHDSQSDAELITRARTADAGAQSVLYGRHLDSATALARQISRNHADADDLVAEAFTKVFGVLGRGGGPDVAFRPYLLTTVRRLAYDRSSREKRVTPSEDPTEGAPGAPFADTALVALDQTLVANAFRQLPERWQAVLWHVEVEQRSPVEVGEILGIKPNAVSALAYRAREGLRRAYLQAHISSDLPPKCRRVASNLGSHVRGGLASREAKQVDDHLEECERCRALAAELTDVNDGMRRVIAPMILGPFAAAYTAAMIEGGKGGLVLSLGKAGRQVGKQVRRAMATPASAAVTVAASAAVVAVVATTLVVLRPDTGNDQASAPRSTTTVTTPDGSSGPDDPGGGPTTSVASPVLTPTTTGSGGSAGDSGSDGLLDVFDPTPTTVGPSAPTTSSPPTTAPAATTTTLPATTTTTAPPSTTTTTSTSTTTTTTPPLAEADLSLTGSQVGSLVEGRNGVIRATLSNDGPDTADDLTVTGEFPDGIRPISGRGSTCTVDGQTVSCELDPLPPGEHDVWFTIAIDQAPDDPITVSVESSASDPTPDDGSVSFVVETVDAGFVSRFATVDHADLRVSGSTILECDVTGNACHHLEDPSSAEVDLSSDGGDGADGDVLFAGLYWAGNLGNPNIDDDGTVTLTTPSGTEEVIEAEEFLQAGNGYQAFANVTGLLATEGSGLYSVAGVHTIQGDNTFGSWSLVVVVRNDELPLRSVVLTDGLLRSSSGDPIPPVLFDGLRFAGDPLGGEARLRLLCYEGDKGLADGGVTVDGDPVLDRNGRPTTDLLVGSPSLGLDYVDLDVSTLLGPNATSAEIGFPGGNDQFWVGAAALVTDYSPAAAAPAAAGAAIGAEFARSAR